MRYLLIIPAFFLDLLQFLLAWAFVGLQAITPVGGGVTGAAVGAAYCYNASTGIISGVLEGVKCAVGGALIGAGASAFAIPLGMVVDAVLSITVGGGLIVLLVFNGSFYWNLVFGGFLAESVPLFSFLPIWTGIVVACVLKKDAEEGVGIGATAFGRAVLGLMRGTNPTAIAARAGAMFMNKTRKTLYSGLPGQGTPPGNNPSPRSGPPGNTPAPRSSQLLDIRPAVKGAALAFMLMVGTYTHAQGLPDPVQYVVSPEVPGPGQTVVIEVQGVGSFLGDSTITWQQDNKTVQSGVGSRTYSFVAGTVGSVTTVHVDIRSSTNGSFTKTLVFRPSTVNIVWEADTSAPPLYAGKTLYSAGSPLRVAAFPVVVVNGARVAPQSLSYQWSRGGNALPNQSGLGRSTLSINGDQLQTQEDIRVDVYFGVNLVARGDISIPATDPLLVLYERDALRGLLTDTAFEQGLLLNAKEVTLVAQPYHFARPALAAGALQYTWGLNNDEIVGPDSAQGILTLRQTGSGAGSAALSVELQNASVEQLVQAAQTAISIFFGSGESSLFGL